MILLSQKHNGESLSQVILLATEPGLNPEVQTPSALSMMSVTLNCFQPAFLLGCSASTSWFLSKYLHDLSPLP